MKAKNFSLICLALLSCIFAVETEKKKEIERLNALDESLRSEVKLLKLELKQFNWLNGNTENCPTEFKEKDCMKKCLTKFKKKDCMLCGGAILHGQLHFKRVKSINNNLYSHVICQSGFQGVTFAIIHSYFYGRAFSSQ